MKPNFPLDPCTSSPPNTAASVGNSTVPSSILPERNQLHDSVTTTSHSVESNTVKSCLADQLNAVHKLTTGEELTLNDCEEQCGVGLLLKIGPQGYPLIYGVVPASAAEVGGV